MNGNGWQERKIDVRKFDRVRVELPECAPYARIIAVPTKTIYCNNNGEHNIDRVFFDLDELAVFFEKWGV